MASRFSAFERLECPQANHVKMHPNLDQVTIIVSSPLSFPASPIWASLIQDIQLEKQKQAKGKKKKSQPTENQKHKQESAKTEIKDTSVCRAVLEIRKIAVSPRSTKGFPRNLGKLLIPSSTNFSSIKNTKTASLCLN